MNGMVKVKDVLPLVKWNDVRLVLAKRTKSVCSGKTLLPRPFPTRFRNDGYRIENDEAILDTVNIYVFGYKKED